MDYVRPAPLEETGEAQYGYRCNVAVKMEFVHGEACLGRCGCEPAARLGNDFDRVSTLGQQVGQCELKTL